MASCYLYSFSAAINSTLFLLILLLSSSPTLGSDLTDCNVKHPPTDGGGHDVPENESAIFAPEDRADLTDFVEPPF